jgi:hypothetical protein
MRRGKGYVMTSDGFSPHAFRRLVTRSVLMPATLLGILALVFLGQIMYLLSGNRSCVAAALQSNGKGLGVLILADPRPSAFTGEHERIADEVAQQLAIAFQQARLREELREHADELEQRVEERTRELQKALESVKQLQGFLPICAWCKKVRDDKDYWHEVEHYVAAHTDAQFTHGICPNCLNKNIGTLE